MTAAEAKSGKPRRKRGLIHEFISTFVYPVLAVVAVYSFFYQPFRIPSGSMVDTLLVGDYVWVNKFAYGYSKHSIPFSPPVMQGRVWSGEPKRGDVIVFKFPPDNSTDYIKRLVGLPGDRVQVKQGTLWINGEPVKEELVGEINYTYREDDGRIRELRGRKFRETLPGGVTHMIIKSYEWDSGYSRDANNTPEYVVPAGHYFMMGDNRDSSTDSRFDQTLDLPRSNDLVRTAGVGMVPFENLVGRADMIFPTSDGSARWWALWEWPGAIRWDRLFTVIE
jgi:signal peptidase I